MTTPTTAELLKYADLQMAAEAFLKTLGAENYSGDALKAALVRGNDHSSKFTQTQAEEFEKNWKVLDQKANTKTGFSGTLFQNRTNGELVLSMRSTEFIDDAARDNQATNNLEIRKTGFAWGQISDMQDWYKNTLAKTGGPLEGKSFSLTGYSLGGHLATAFNLLNPTAASQTVTFNGAGVGQITQGTLNQALDEFNLMRGGDTVLIAAKLNDSVLTGHYNAIRTGLANASMTYTSAQTYLDNAYSATGGVSGKALELWQMLGDMKTIADLAVRVNTLTASATDSSHPDLVAATVIAALNLDYRMAVYLSGQSSKSAAIISGAVQAYGSKAMLGIPVTNTALLNQFDVVADTSPSMVANSQWHYGKNVRVTIEDQPLYRGGIVLSAADQSWDYGNVELLVDGYANKDFGDTHSLVLLQDSLNVQNTLLQLLPPDQRGSTAQGVVRAILNVASNLVKTNGDALFGSGQGKAEGNVLENTLNALADLVLGPVAAKALRLTGSTDGGTWADIGDENSGRTRFYNLLKQIQDSSLFKKAANGTLTLQLATPTSELATLARTDFGAYAALYSLSPFVLKFGTSAAEAEVKALWGNIYTDWATTDTHPSTVSDQWLKDRAALLERKTTTTSATPATTAASPAPGGQKTPTAMPSTTCTTKKTSSGNGKKAPPTRPSSAAKPLAAPATWCLVVRAMTQALPVVPTMTACTVALAPTPTSSAATGAKTLCATPMAKAASPSTATALAWPRP
ncbi:MAG: hypothetical protein IPN06_08820 [Burkholderiales bacterium]|nr:hypothetical protein [Burkholderiales bacterium]